MEDLEEKEENKRGRQEMKLIDEEETRKCLKRFDKEEQRGEKRKEAEDPKQRKPENQIRKRPPPIKT